MKTTNENLFFFQHAFGIITLIHYFIFFEHGHSLDEIDHGRTCLHSSSEIDYLPIVQYLNEKGGNIDAKDNDEKLIFILYLIEKGANIEAKNHNQKTPLHVACENGNIQIVQYLIEKGADIEAKDKDQNTPLHQEFDIQKPQTIERNNKYYPFLKFFNTSNQRKWGSPSSYSISLIDFCCLYGSLKCFKYLLLNKCEITEKTLKYSIAGGNQEIIVILQQYEHSFE